MAESLRQAYDYWQDQPGNYYPKRDEAPSTPRYWLPSRVFSLGRSSSMAFKVNLRNQFEKSKTITTSPPSAPLERTSESHGPRIRPPCSSNLTKFERTSPRPQRDRDRGLR